MDIYLSRAQQLLSSPDASHSASDGFVQLLKLDVSTHQTLQTDLRSRLQKGWASDTIARKIKASTGVLAEEALRIRIAQVLEALLAYVSNNPPVEMFTTLSPSLPLQAWIAAHQSYAQFFSRCSTLFAHPSSPASFQNAFRYVSSTFLTLSMRTDKLSHTGAGGGKWDRLTDCTSRLAGPVRAAGMDRTGAGSDGTETKRAAVMWLGNDCLRGYFKLNNLKLCETVIKSIQEALSRNSLNEGVAESIYPRSDRVRYRYYLGRVRLSQGKVRVAFEHLSWALENCYWSGVGVAPPQIRRILLHLLPATLVLGLRPTSSTSSLLASHFPDLVDWYGTLFEAVAKPSLGAFEQAMAVRERKEYLRRQGVWLLIKEKAVIAIWRGIVKRCLLLSLPSSFAASNAPPTLSLAQIHRALPFFLSTSSSLSATTTVDTYSQLDVECILASLVDQAYVKGYTFHSKGLVVFQKGDRMGFVPVSGVY